jgi:hypothetical protein
MTVSPSALNYGSSASSLPLTISVAGCNQPVDFTMTPSQSWIAVPSFGSVPANGEVVIQVRILRQQLATGTNTGQITISSLVGQLVVQVTAIRSGTGPPGGPGGFQSP